MLRLFRQWRERRAYWDKPPVGKFRIHYESPFFYLERFSPSQHKWKFVSMSCEKEKLRKDVVLHKQREAEAPEYFD